MKKKNTDGLQQELMDSPDLTQFLSQNQEQFVNRNVAELLNHLFEEKNISKAALAKKAGIADDKKTAVSTKSEATRVQNRVM